VVPAAVLSVYAQAHAPGIANVVAADVPLDNIRADEAQSLDHVHWFTDVPQVPEVVVIDEGRPWQPVDFFLMEGPE